MLLEKVYDTVWRPKIFNSFNDIGLRGNLLIFVGSFLPKQKFCVRVGPSHSEYVDQEEGLLQGSVLSIICFTIAINQITNN